jgi:hypothetical protein
VCEYVASTSDVEDVVRNNTTFCIYVWFIHGGPKVGMQYIVYNYCIPTLISPCMYKLNVRITVLGFHTFWQTSILTAVFSGVRLLYLPTDQYDNCRITHLPLSDEVLRIPSPFFLNSEYLCIFSLIWLTRVNLWQILRLCDGPDNEWFSSVVGWPIFGKYYLSHVG